MPAVSSVLVVGAGTAGAATAIFLARDGIAVDLAEVQPAVTALGSGITLPLPDVDAALSGSRA